MPYRLVYVTTASTQEARRIGQAMVVRRLAACANLIPMVESLYWWEGAVQSETEAIVLMKTTAEAYPRLESAVREMHGYKCPCIVAVEIADGSAAYLEWLGQNVTGA